MRLEAASIIRPFPAAVIADRPDGTTARSLLVRACIPVNVVEQFAQRFHRGVSSIGRYNFATLIIRNDVIRSDRETVWLLAHRIPPNQNAQIWKYKSHGLNAGRRFALSIDRLYRRAVIQNAPV